MKMKIEGEATSNPQQNSNLPKNQFDIEEKKRPEELLLKLLIRLKDLNTILRGAVDSWNYAGENKAKWFLWYAEPYLILFIQNNVAVWNEWAKKPDKSLIEILEEDRYKTLLEDYERCVTDGKKMAQSMVLALEAFSDALKSGGLSKEDVDSHSSKLGQVGKQSPEAYQLSIDLINRFPEKFKESLNEVLICERQYLNRLNLQDHLKVMNRWAGKEYLNQIMKQADIYDRKCGTRGFWDSGRPHEYTGYIYEEFFKLLDRHDRDKGKFEHLLAKVLRLVRPGYKKNDRLRIKKSSAKIEQFAKPGLEHPSAGDDDLSNYIGEGSDGSPDNFEHVESLTEDDILGSIGQKQRDSTLTLDDIFALDKTKDFLKHLIYLPDCKLTIKEQQVLFYRMRGDEYKKIAQKIKIKAPTVKMLGWRGLEKLKAYAKQNNDELLESILF